MTLTIILVLFFIVAFLYASVGHGGASGYIAILILAGLPTQSIREMALTFNLFVAAVSFLLFYKAGHFRKSLFLPLAISSVPLAWIGAHIKLPDNYFKFALAACLLLAVIRLLFFSESSDETNTVEMKFFHKIITGATIGFISGMIGIGGGVLLSPLLLLMKWSTVKESAAVSAPFIFVNSVAALLALPSLNYYDDKHFLTWLTASIAGGLAGAYFGSNQFKNSVLKFILATVLLIATGKLIF